MGDAGLDCLIWNLFLLFFLAHNYDYITVGSQQNFSVTTSILWCMVISSSPRIKLKNFRIRSLLIKKSRLHPRGREAAKQKKNRSQSLNPPPNIDTSYIHHTSNIEEMGGHFGHGWVLRPNKKWQLAVRSWKWQNKILKKFNKPVCLVRIWHSITRLTKNNQFGTLWGDVMGTSKI